MNRSKLSRMTAQLVVSSGFVGFLLFWPTAASASLTAGPLTIVSPERHLTDGEHSEYEIDLPVINPDAEVRNRVTVKVISIDPTIGLEEDEKIEAGNIPAGATRHVRFLIYVSRDHSKKAQTDGSRDRLDELPPPALNLSALSFVFDAQIGRRVGFSQPTVSTILSVMSSVLPSSPTTGNPVLMQIGNSSMEIDSSARTPTTAMGACVQWVTACLAPPGRTLDDCTFSVPACQTQTPWTEDGMCCPATCYAQYKAARLSGMSDMSAMLETYIDDGSCIPQFQGLRSVRGGK